MDTPATSSQEPFDTEAIAGQREHWAATFDANPDNATDRSAPALAAAGRRLSVPDPALRTRPPSAHPWRARPRRGLCAHGLSMPFIAG